MNADSGHRGEARAQYPAKVHTSPNYDSPAGRVELKRFAKWTREELIANLMLFWREAIQKDAELIELKPTLARLRTADADNARLQETLKHYLDTIGRYQTDNATLQQGVAQRDAAIVKLVLTLTKGC